MHQHPVHAERAPRAPASRKDCGRRNRSRSPDRPASPAIRRNSSDGATSAKDRRRRPRRGWRGSALNARSCRSAIAFADDARRAGLRARRNPAAAEPGFGLCAASDDRHRKHHADRRLRLQEPEHPPRRVCAPLHDQIAIARIVADDLVAARDVQAEPQAPRSGQNGDRRPAASAASPARAARAPRQPAHRPTPNDQTRRPSRNCRCAAGSHQARRHDEAQRRAGSSTRQRELRGMSPQRLTGGRMAAPAGRSDRSAAAPPASRRDRCNLRPARPIGR